MVVDRLRAVINLTNLLKNYQSLKRLNDDKDIFCVVKADAYGHGSVSCAKFLEENGAKHFAVTGLVEALELRENGLIGEILIFSKTDVLNAEYLSKNNISQTVFSYDYAKALNDQGFKINIQINVDTGMSRLGLFLHEEKDLKEVLETIKKISQLTNLNITGIYSHFTSSESDEEFTKKQAVLFSGLIDMLNKEKINYGKIHLANSSAIVKQNIKTYDLARSGIALYGYPPVKSEEKFLPVMSVYAKVIQITSIHPGDSVSYNRTFIAKEEMKIATIAVGYADGYPRILSNNDFVYYNGYELPVIGRICMGLTMINVTGVEISEGEEVEVFGENKLLEPMAKRALTITYEILTNMAKPRVKKFYIKD